jgi:hypothetical protein
VRLWSSTAVQYAAPADAMTSIFADPDEKQDNGKQGAGSFGKWSTDPGVNHPSARVSSCPWLTPRGVIGAMTHALAFQICRTHQREVEIKIKKQGNRDAQAGTVSQHMYSTVFCLLLLAHSQSSSGEKSNSTLLPFAKENWQGRNIGN